MFCDPHSGKATFDVSDIVHLDVIVQTDDFGTIQLRELFVSNMLISLIQIYSGNRLIEKKILTLNQDMILDFSKEI